MTLFVVLCVLFVATLAGQFVAVRTELGMADLGFEAQRTSDALVGVHPGWPELDMGDRLISINGLDPTREDFFSLKTKVAPGPVTVVFERDGEVRQLTGEAVPMPVPKMLAVLARWLTGVVLVLLGMVVFLLRPGAKVSWLFFVFLGELGMVVVIGPGFPLRGMTTFAMVGTLFISAPAFGVHLFTEFPSELPKVRPLVWVMHALTVVVGLGYGLVFLTGRFSPEAQGLYASVTRVLTVLVALPMLSVVTYQWWAARKNGTARLEAMTRTLMLATYLGLFVPLVVNVIVRVLRLEGSWAHQVSAAAVIAFALTAASVTVQHNPFEIDRYAGAVVGYVVTLGALGALFVSSLIVVPLVVKRLGFANSSEALVVVTALTFASFGPVYRRLRKAVDRWFSREQADALQTSDVFRRIADSVQNESQSVSLGRVVEAAMLLGAERSALWQVDASGRSFHRVLWQGGPASVEPQPRDGPLAPALDRSGGVAHLSPGRLPAETQEALWQVDLAMSAPVRAHGVPVGFLAVGRRASGFGYRDEDLAFLDTLASQAGLALERGEVVRQIGRYRVERRLATGGMAEIFVAWQLGPGGFERKVALKRLLPELAEDPRSAAGLLDEARITARLQHPNIAQVYEVGLEAGQHFIAMEFIEGAALRSIMAGQHASGLATPLPVALAVAQGLLGALEHAHQLKDADGTLLNVVHRDVTPANVLVSSRGEAKLLDFGLVMASTRLFRTQTGVARGTVPYMSPEQAMHDTVDARSDVFAAGATLYELFTGVRAFPEGVTGPRPAPASTVNAKLPKAFDQVFTGALAFSMNERYPSAAAFWQALVNAAGATPVAPAAEVAEWVARHAKHADPPPKSEAKTRSSSVPVGQDDPTGRLET